MSNTMEPLFFYTDPRGVRTGPLTEAQLEQLAAIGGIEWTGQIELDGLERSWRVGEVGWLADALMRSRKRPGTGRPGDPAKGAPTPTPPGAAEPPSVPPDAVRADEPADGAAPIAACTRPAYILLALLPALVGIFGVHNIVAGYTGRGIAQLVLSIFTLGGLAFAAVAPPCCCIGLPLWLVLVVWTLVDVATVTRDARGVAMG